VSARRRWSSGLRRTPGGEQCVNADESDTVDRGTSVALNDDMLPLSLTLLVATFCVALARLAQACKGERSLVASRATLVAHERLAA
jgi:uncharacterized SAM-dependent methyltransferase